MRTALLYTLLRILQKGGAGDLYRWFKMPQQRKRFAERFRIAASRPMSGPEVDKGPAATVNSIDEYLDLCRTLETQYEGSSRIVYRGQTRDHFLPNTNPQQISLLPSLARGDNPPKHHTSRMLRIYREYLFNARKHHITFLSKTRRHAFLLEEVLDTGGLCPFPDAQMLADQPDARFLMSLFPMRTDPYLFEAALQHYGFPTLNLDVTCSPLVGLYFALHRFAETENGSLAANPTGGGGVVYLMSVPEGSAEFPTTSSRFGVYRGPRSVDLFEMTYDNNGRPRRQYAVLLVEAGHVWADDPPQFNIYSTYLRHRIQLSADFWKEPSTRRFIDAGLGGWFLPGADVDTLFRWFREIAPRHFPDYSVGPWQKIEYSGGRFEFLQPRRIVLTGSDAAAVLRILMFTWPGRAGWLEILPLDEVKRIASDPGKRESLDIVVTCEPALQDAVRMQEEITQMGTSSGRLFTSFATGHLGDYRASPAALPVVIGEMPYLVFNDPYDSDFDHQRKLFDCLRLLTRLRYDRRMNPGAGQWETYLLAPNTVGLGP